MLLRLYNSLTRKVEPLKPLKGNTFRIYACGPTVYSRIHLGNFRTYIAEDVLRRTLEFFGYRVKLVMNVTDVGHLTSDADTGEDKVEAAAQREHKTATAITDQYTKLFIEDSRRLNLRLPARLVKATDHIADQLNVIKELERRGFTYTTDDGLYFETTKLPDYGVFRTVLGGESHRLPTDRAKHHPADFALWKFSKPSEARQQEWDSPWGRGYPGWHIECSAMATKYLGQQFDLHLGGVDHLSIHHENEIAQNQAAFGTLMARHWFHVNFLVQKGEKMAKSTGKSFSLDELAAQGIEPLAFRFYCLHHHYRSLIEFDLDELKRAQDTLNDIRASLLRNTFGLQSKEANLQKFLQDDLAIPSLISALHKRKNPFAWLYFDEVLGLNLMDSTEPLSEGQQKMVDQREALRAARKFREADQLRKQLESDRIRIEDTPAGPRVFRLPEGL